MLLDHVLEQIELLLEVGILIVENRQNYPNLVANWLIIADKLDLLAFDGNVFSLVATNLYFVNDPSLLAFNVTKLSLDPVPDLKVKLGLHEHLILLVQQQEVAATKVQLLFEHLVQA